MINLYDSSAENKEKSLEECYDELENRHTELKESYEDLYEKFRTLTSELSNFFSKNKSEVINSVVNTVIDELKNISSPEPIEGIKNSFDYWGVLQNEGGDNSLYQLAEELLNFSIYQAIIKLDVNDKIVLCVSLIDSRDSLDYFLNCDYIDDVPELILQGQSADIIQELKQYVFDKIPYRERYS